MIVLWSVCKMCIYFYILFLVLIPELYVETPSAITVESPELDKFAREIPALIKSQTTFARETQWHT